MQSIYTERRATLNLTPIGLFPGTPTGTDDVFVYSSQTEQNPLVTNRLASTISRLSIPITLFSPQTRHLSPTISPRSSISALRNPRSSHISDASDPFSTPRASRIRILPRNKIAASPN